jgi:FMN hydrolase / 5-amino-6-(5-phospho-D-ribitylamino)uracil phosphatase
MRQFYHPEGFSMSAPLLLSFDLDDTLWPIAPVMLAAEDALWSWLHAQHPQVMRQHSAATVRELRAQVALEYPHRSHDMTFLRHRVIMKMFGKDQAAQRHADAAFEIFYAERNRVSLYDDARGALLRLRRRYRLFALSNGNADLQRCGIDELFDGHITAIAAGAAKPDARIFRHLLAAAGVNATQVVHIGDDPYADVQGAMAAGMQAIWLNRDARPWPEELAPPPRTISTLAEIF